MKPNSGTSVWFAAMAALFFHCTPARAVDPIFLFGTHFGGDELAEVYYVGWGYSEEIKAGELISLAVGLVQPLSDTVEIQATVGWKADQVSASNGDIDWYRYPFDVLVFFNVTDNVRLGGGLTYHLNPRLRGKGFADDISIDFDNALGFAVEGGYEFNFGLYVGGVVTVIDYEESVTGHSVDGNSIGALVGYRFR